MSIMPLVSRCVKRPPNMLWILVVQVLSVAGVLGIIHILTLPSHVPTLFARRSCIGPGVPASIIFFMSSALNPSMPAGIFALSSDFASVFGAGAFVGVVAGFFSVPG